MASKNKKPNLRIVPVPTTTKRDFTFIMDSHEPAMDFQTGLSTPVAVVVSASDLGEALIKLADYGAGMGWADDPSDYQSDIDDGNITVVLATRFE